MENLTLAGAVLLSVCVGFGFGAGSWLWRVVESWFTVEEEKKAGGRDAGR